MTRAADTEPGTTSVLLPTAGWITLGALFIGCVVLAAQGPHLYPSLHLALDTTIFLLALVLTVCLVELAGRTGEATPLWLGLTFAIVALLSLLHLAVSFDWFGAWGWIARDAALLRPATWPPAVHLLPIGTALALSPYAARGNRSFLFLAGLVLLGLAFLLIFQRLPRFTDPMLLGFTRPSLLLVPLLWAAVCWMAWSRRRHNRLMLPVALMGAILLVANVPILYSRSLDDTASMVTHLGRTTGLLAFLIGLMHLASADMLARDRAEHALALLNRDLEARVEERTRELDEANQRLAEEIKGHGSAEGRFRAVVEHASSGMVMVDGGGRIALVNREAERLFGYDRGELMGQRIELLVPAQSRSAHLEERQSFQHRPVPRSMGAGRELFGLRKDGQEVPIEIGLNPIQTAEGSFVLASVVDITKRKQAEQELLRSNQELERFAYVASHDLQEPLRMVGSFVQLLSKRYRGRLDADADEYIAFAVDGATRMQRLIEDLLAFSRIGSRGAPLAPTDLNDVMASVCHDLSVSIDEAHATVSHELLPHVLADQGQMSQVFTNLVSNAIKFRRDVPPRVMIEARRAGAWWEVSVRDNGIGIEPHYFDRIFVLFQRLHTREEYGGTGIGLAIAKKIVERHGGRLWVESVPGEGSTFRFTLQAVGPPP